MPGGTGAAAGVLLAAALGYFALPYTLDFLGRPDLACSLYPGELSLEENRLQRFASVEEAEAAADRILDITDLSMVAWDCKFAAAAQRGDLPAMAEAKYQYLRLNPYRGEVYEEFAALLENSGGGARRRELARMAISRLEETREKTSPLAYRIVDRPDWAFAPDVLARLERIAGENGG